MCQWKGIHRKQIDLLEISEYNFGAIQNRQRRVFVLSGETVNFINPFVVNRMGILYNNNNHSKRRKNA